MENFLELLKQFFCWFIGTDLPRATVEYVLNCVTYIMEDFVPLMWEYYSTFFGIVAP